MKDQGLRSHAAGDEYCSTWYRPNRDREGGEGTVQMRNVDITDTLDRKLPAILELKTSNRRYALQTMQRLGKAGRPSPMLRAINEESAGELVQAYVQELAETIGGKHTFRYGEEFNHLGTPAAHPDHLLKHPNP